VKAALLDQDETEAHEQLEVWLKAWIAMYPTSRSPQDQGKHYRVAFYLRSTGYPFDAMH
jgi:hypothetical protein